MMLSTQFPAYRLKNGRSIQMESLYRTRTYVHLLAGSPDRLFNYRVIRRLCKMAALTEFVGGSAHAAMILPTRIWDLRSGQWETADWYRFRTIPRSPRRNPTVLIPEWMPQFATIGRFTSEPIPATQGNYSVLSVIWFQEGMDSLIDEHALKELLDLPWDSSARNVPF